MRLPDELPLDPEIVAELEALDATLAGEPVDPRHAELAELALLLAGERPAPGAGFGARMDGLVLTRRFAEPSSAGSRWDWLRRPAFASALVSAMAAVIAVVALSGGSTPPLSPGGPVRSSAGASSSGTSASASSGASARASSGTSGTSGTVHRLGALGALGALGPAHRAALGVNGSRKAPAATGVPATTPSPNGALSAPGPQTFTPAPAPVPTGRKLVQSAQLQLLTASGRIDVVSQELFIAVGQLGGIVRSSNITQAGPGGYAFFSLSIPSGNLQEAMARLSTLPHATVASRTDATQDVTDQYGADVRRLADARALRTSLLKQLAAAVTTTQIDSLEAQIHDAEASISSDEATLRGLGHQIDYSSLSVQIDVGAAPVPVTHKTSTGFTLGRAVHDAGRVLTVAAGVALIVLAALVPIALLVALGVWIAASVRRHRRERALDTA